MPLSILINNFTAGELTELLDSLANLAKYYNACQKLENLGCLPYRTGTKRPD